MRMRFFGAVIALGLSSMFNTVQAATFSNFNLDWSASFSTSNLIGVYVSSPDVTNLGDQAFDIQNFSMNVSGTLTVLGGVGDSFTSADVGGLNLNVTSSSAKFAPFTIDLSNVQLGLIEGTIVQDTLNPLLVRGQLTRWFLTAEDPSSPFRLQFGCFSTNCNSTSSVFNNPPIGRHLLNGAAQGTIGAPLVITDGTSDACCGARANAAIFYYDNQQSLLDSISLQGREFDSDQTPVGLPSPVPLPAGLPLLLVALMPLAFVARRARK